MLTAVATAVQAHSASQMYNAISQDSRRGTEQAHPKRRERASDVSPFQARPADSHILAAHPNVPARVHGVERKRVHDVLWPVLGRRSIRLGGEEAALGIAVSALRAGLVGLDRRRLSIPIGSSAEGV